MHTLLLVREGNSKCGKTLLAQKRTWNTNKSTAHSRIYDLVSDGSLFNCSLFGDLLFDSSLINDPLIDGSRNGLMRNESLITWPPIDDLLTDSLHINDPLIDDSRIGEWSRGNSLINDSLIDGLFITNHSSMIHSSVTHESMIYYKTIHESIAQ